MSAAEPTAIVLREGDVVKIAWAGIIRSATLHQDYRQCGNCFGAVVRLEPPWEGWELLCTKDVALTVDFDELTQTKLDLPPFAIGIVSQIPVRLEVVRAGVAVEESREESGNEIGGGPDGGSEEGPPGRADAGPVGGSEVPEEPPAVVGARADAGAEAQPRQKRSHRRRG